MNIVMIEQMYILIYLYIYICIHIYNKVSRRIAEFILLVSYLISRISNKIDRLCRISVNGGSLQRGTNSDTNLVIPHLTFSVSRGNTQAWLSGLRRWLKSPVRNGVGSNPTADKYFSSLPYQ